MARRYITEGGQWALGQERERARPLVILAEETGTGALGGLAPDRGTHAPQPGWPGQRAARLGALPFRRYSCSLSHGVHNRAALGTGPGPSSAFSQREGASGKAPRHRLRPGALLLELQRYAGPPGGAGAQPTTPHGAQRLPREPAAATTWPSLAGTPCVKWAGPSPSPNFKVLVSDQNCCPVCRGPVLMGTTWTVPGTQER